MNVEPNSLILMGLVLRTCVVHVPGSPELVERKTPSRPRLKVPAAKLSDIA